jgi:nucleoside-diphosphate-sugar epimerase
MVERLVKEGFEVRATDLSSPSSEDDPKRGRYPGLSQEIGSGIYTSNLAQPDNLQEVVKRSIHVFHIAALFSYAHSLGSTPK